MPPDSRSFLSRLKEFLSETPAPPSPAAETAETGSRSPSRWGEILRVQALTVSLLAKKVTADEVFRHVVEGAAVTLGADDASLMLVDGDDLRVVSASQTQERTIGWQGPIRVGDGVAGLVAQTGTPVLLNEGDDLSRFPNLVPKGRRIQSALSVPLEVGGRVVGVLNASRLGGGERFTPEDLAVLRLFAGTAALAIDQTSLLQRAQARSRALDTLLSVSDAFDHGVELEAALAAVMPRLGAAFRPAQALAFLGTVEAGCLAAVAAWTPETGTAEAAELGSASLRLGGDVDQAFQRRHPTWIDALALDGAPAGWPAPRRRLIVPVGAAETSTRCAIVLGWDEPDLALAPEDLRVLDSVARQVALALSHQDRAAAAGTLETEMAQARAHLVEVERLATFGQSMAGLVHDINAPLTALLTVAQLMQKESAEATSRERAGQIVEAARRAQRLVRELLTMARPQPPTFERVDLHAVLRAAMDLERAQCAVSGIKLVADFTPELPPLTADPHRLGQVFINLLVNARQAMDAAERGDTITVRTRRTDGAVEIHVADNGPGIPPTLRAKIFDWFFTTKPPGEGTGLGLAVSREILVAHGGNLRLEETPGGGATFVLELPCPPADEAGG